MTLGVADRQASLLDDMSEFCEKTLAKDSIYAFLHRERDRLFPDEAFADLFADDGRRSVPPSVVAAVMVLQRLEACLTAKQQSATRSTPVGATPRVSAATTPLNGRSSPTRCSSTCASACGDRPIPTGSLRSCSTPPKRSLVGRKRVLDSTPLYDAVATMDTITLIRSAVRNLLKVTDGSLRAECWPFSRAGDYASSDKLRSTGRTPSARASRHSREGRLCLPPGARRP